MSDFQADSFGQQRAVSIKVTKQQSRRATWSLRCVMPFFVPVLPFVGAVLGMVAMGEIAKNAARTGAGRAKLAVVLGLIFTAVQGVLGWQGWQYARTARTAPQAALQAGQAGDIAAFVDQFSALGTENDIEQAFGFLTLVRDRYGECRDASINLPQDWYAAWRPFEPFTYDITFANQTITATAQVVMRPDIETFGQPRLAYITLHDPKRSDLRFPPDAATAKALASVDIDSE